VAEEAGAAPPAELQAQGAPQANDSRAGALADSSARESEKAPALGTGHGRREESHSRQVAFERATAKPVEVIRIRYDSRENLVAMGVIHTPRPRVPDPFPDSRMGYVPDP
jgi:hypothetical protein